MFLKWKVFGFFETGLFLCVTALDVLELALDEAGLGDLPAPAS